MFDLLSIEDVKAAAKDTAKAAEDVPIISWGIAISAASAAASALL